MWRLKLLLLPFGAIAELTALATCWLLFVFGSKKKASEIHNWATSTLPTLDWYTRDGSKRGKYNNPR